jgi:teichuronic acid biosynthesis glycosyltransferase TuaC
MNPLAKRFKIFIIIPGSSEGNSMIFSKRQVADLREQGLEVQEYYLASRTNPIHILKDLFRIRAAVRSFNPDIVHAHYGTMTALLGAFCGARKYAITFHGSDLNFVRSEFFLKELLAKCLSQFAALRSDMIFCVSDRLRQKLWWRRDVAVVIPFGVDLLKYFPIDRAEARERLHLPSHVKLVLFNDSAPVKRSDIARSAIELLNGDDLKIELYTLSGGIEYETMLLLLNACDCLLLCSDSEGSPVMVKEAMACNLPVVATDVGDVVSVMDGCSPSAIAAQDPISIANALKAVIFANTRSNGRDLIRKKVLDSKGITERVIAKYSDVLMNRKHG